jgi:outer membrane protein assembly factor BamE (lipoprotein component of BamABCDE complex)
MVQSADAAGIEVSELPGLGSRTRRMRTPLFVFACLLLGACSFLEWQPQLRGNRVDADQLKELVPGTSTRTDVTALIGSPTATATFDDNTWLYISEVTRPEIARTNGVLSQHVLVLTFNDQGVLQNIKQLNQDDSVPVSVVARSTPSPGTEASFLQQLFGNIGRFNPAGSALGGPTVNSPSGGAPAPAY